MACRRTEEGILVLEGTWVWEILWAYRNPEVSEPYVIHRKASEIPLNVKIWFHKYNAEAECTRRLHKAAISRQSAPKTENPVINQ